MKRKKDWVGLKVKTLEPISSGVMRIVAGTICTVTRNHGGLTLVTDECGTCGVGIYIRKVPESAVELLCDGELDAPAVEENLRNITVEDFLSHNARPEDVSATTGSVLESDKRVAVLLVDPSISFWLKDAIRAGVKRDPLDALNDARVLQEVLKERLDEIMTKSENLRPEG